MNYYSATTYYGAPFTWFAHELENNGAAKSATNKISYLEKRQINFVIFLTDGLASDYKPDDQGKDQPFGGDYSAPLKYAGAHGLEFCNSRGWCDGDGTATTYQVRTSGNCGAAVDAVGESKIISKAACDAGAATVGWGDTLAQLISSSNKPPGCFFYNNILYFNDQSPNTYACSSSDQCLCAVTSSHECLEKDTFLKGTCVKGQATNIPSFKRQGMELVIPRDGFCYGGYLLLTCDGTIEFFFIPHSQRRIF